MLLNREPSLGPLSSNASLTLSHAVSTCADCPNRPHALHGTASRACASRAAYLTSESILNIGRYMLMMITPTMQPTPTIISGSMIEVSAWIDASTSSS